MKASLNPRQVGRVTPCAPSVELSSGNAQATFQRRARSDAPYLLCLLVAAAFVALAFVSAAQESQPTNTIRFRAVDVFVDSTNKPLAAYQLEFTASAGARIVGIEGGGHATFKEAPFYDVKAMQHERVIIGAFSTAKADKLPTGKTRVATIHLQIQPTGDQPPRFEVQVKAAATVGGKKISVHANAEEKQRNENDQASGPK